MSSLPRIPALPAERGPLPFASYAQLLRMLVPPTHRVAFYDAHGRALWISDGVEEPEFRMNLELVLARASDPDPAEGDHPLAYSSAGGGDPVYIFPIRSTEHELLGALGLACRNLPASATYRRFETVQRLLLPVLEILVHGWPEPQRRRELNAIDRALSDSADDQPKANTPTTTPLPALLRRTLVLATRSLECAFGSIIAIDRPFTLSHRASADESELSMTAAIDTVRSHIVKWVAARKQAITVNAPSATNDRRLPYKLLALPLCDESQRLVAIVMLFRSIHSHDFSRADIQEGMRFVLQLPRVALGELMGGRIPLDKPKGAQAAKSAVQPRPSASAASPRSSNTDSPSSIGENAALSAQPPPTRSLDEPRTQRKAPAAARSAVARRSTPNAPPIKARASVSNAQASASQPKPGATSVSVKPQATERESPAVTVPTPSAAAQSAIAPAPAAEVTAAPVVSAQSAPIFVLPQGPEQRVRSVLQQGGFELYVQRIAPVRNVRRAERYEVLLRMKEGEQVRPPQSFFASAEAVGLTPEVDRCIIRNVLSLLHGRAVMLRTSCMEFAVNLAGASLTAEDFGEFIATEVHRSAVPPSLLVFEVAEGDALEHRQSLELVASRLREAGCRLALDNCRGYIGKLAQMPNWPVTCMKIDGFLVRNLLSSTQSESQLKAVLRLASDMGAETVAECVETAGVRDKLAALEVDYVQGFHVGKPQPLRSLLV